MTFPRAFQAQVSTSEGVGGAIREHLDRENELFRPLFRCLGVAQQPLAPLILLAGPSAAHAAIIPLPIAHALDVRHQQGALAPLEGGV